MTKGKILHRVNLLYPNFYLDVVEVGRYVRIHTLGPTFDGMILKVDAIAGFGLTHEQYRLEGYGWFSDTNIELLPADYVYRAEHEAAIHVLGEDYFA